MSDKVFGKARAKGGGAPTAAAFYRWTPAGDEYVADWKLGKLTWTWKGSPSRKCLWVFDASSDYRPGARVMKERVLVVLDFGADGDRVVRNDANWIVFPTEAFKGETKHPENVIVKENEVGAYGIGAELLPRLSVVGIRLATKQEVAKVLGLNIKEVSKTPSW